MELPEQMELEKVNEERSTSDYSEFMSQFAPGLGRIAGRGVLFSNCIINMLIGITGTDGAGKGEKVFIHFRKRLTSIFGENGDNLYSVCKTPAPVMIVIDNNTTKLC